MKTLFAVLAITLSAMCSPVQASTQISLSTPATVNLPASTNYCRAASATTAAYATVVTGFTADGNYVTGQVQSHFTCGHSTTVYVCTYLQWDLSGNLVSENTPVSSQNRGTQSLYCPVVPLNQPSMTPPSNSVVGNEFENAGGYVAETLVEEICGSEACYARYNITELVTP